MKSLPSLSILALFSFLISCQNGPAPELILQGDAKKVLTHVLHHQEKWVKVHAAEFLIDLRHKHGIDSIFRKEGQQYQDEAPYRIGIWRVLSKVHKNKQEWLSKITKVARDTGATDQIHAIETLAKLQESHQALSPALQSQILHSDHTRLKAYTQWLLAIPSNSEEHPAIDQLRLMLRSTDVEEKRIAALALRKINYFPKEDWNDLYQLAMDEPSGSKAKIYMISAALVLCPDEQLSEYEKLENILLSYKNAQSKSSRYVLCETLAEIGHPGHLPLLGDLMYMNNPIINLETMEAPQEHPVNIDVSAAAAYAILKICAKWGGFS